MFILPKAEKQEEASSKNVVADPKNQSELNPWFASIEVHTKIETNNLQGNVREKGSMLAKINLHQGMHKEKIFLSKSNL